MRQGGRSEAAAVSGRQDRAPDDAGRRQGLGYDATVGSLPVLDEKGKTIADVMFIAYTVPGANRPVTFALNGGPGASSVYLNLGAIGPKRVQFGAEGNSPSDPATPIDNPGTWLDFTDLVFIDPVGTGFSRARVGEDEAKKKFYATGADIEYLSRIIYDWLVKNDRLMSRKYLVGESYGGFRGPRITHFLQTRLGVAMNGVVLVSPYLDPAAERRRRPVAAAVDADPAEHLRGESRAPGQAHRRGDERRSSTTRAATTSPTCSRVVPIRRRSSASSSA